MRSPTRGDAGRPIGDIPRVDDETIPVRRRQLLTLIGRAVRWAPRAAMTRAMSGGCDWCVKGQEGMTHRTTE
jgi:hypothetical protein